MKASPVGRNALRVAIVVAFAVLACGLQAQAGEWKPGEPIPSENELAVRYRAALADFPVILPPSAPDGYRHGYHLFAIRVDNRLEVFTALRAQGIGARLKYKACPA